MVNSATSTNGDENASWITLIGRLSKRRVRRLFIFIAFLSICFQILRVIQLNSRKRYVSMKQNDVRIYDLPKLKCPSRKESLNKNLHEEYYHEDCFVDYSNSKALWSGDVSSKYKKKS